MPKPIRELIEDWPDARKEALLRRVDEQVKQYLDIENSFVYHAPKPDQLPRYEELRDKARELAHLLTLITPAGRYQSLAITHLENSIMWANKAIACDE